MEGIVARVTPEVRGLGLQDSRENCWRFFINRVRLQLKVTPFKELTQFSTLSIFFHFKRRCCVGETDP